MQTPATRLLENIIRDELSLLRENDDPSKPTDAEKKKIVDKLKEMFRCVYDSLYKESKKGGVEGSGVLTPSAQKKLGIDKKAETARIDFIYTKLRSTKMYNDDNYSIPCTPVKGNVYKLVSQALIPKPPDRFDPFAPKGGIQFPSVKQPKKTPTDVLGLGEGSWCIKKPSASDVRRHTLIAKNLWKYRGANNLWDQFVSFYTNSDDEEMALKVMAGNIKTQDDWYWVNKRIANYQGASEVGGLYDYMYNLVPAEFGDSTFYDKMNIFPGDYVEYQKRMGIKMRKHWETFYQIVLNIASDNRERWNQGMKLCPNFKAELVGSNTVIRSYRSQGEINEPKLGTSTLDSLADISSEHIRPDNVILDPSGYGLIRDQIDWCNAYIAKKVKILKGKEWSRQNNPLMFGDMSNSTMKFIATDPDGVLFIAQFLLMFVPGWGLVYSTLAGFLRAEAYKEANPDDLIGYYLILIETVAFLGAAKGADLAVKLLVKASSTSKRVIISWFMKHGSKPTSEASVDALKLLSAEQQAIINAMIRNPESIKIASETAVKTIQNQFVRFFANSLKNLTKLARSLNDLVLITWLKSQLRNATSPQAVKLINSIVSFALTWEGFSAIYEFTSAEAIEFLKAWAEDSGYNERALQKEYVKFADEAINNLIEKDPQAVARIMETNKTKDSFHVSPEMIEKAEKSTKEWKRQNPEKAKNMIDLSATNDSTSVLDLLGGVNESKILDKIIRATLI